MMPVNSWLLIDKADKRRGRSVRYQSRTSYRSLLAKCEFSYQRTTQQDQSCSPSKVMTFEEGLEKLMDVAQRHPKRLFWLAMKPRFICKPP